MTSIHDVPVPDEPEDVIDIRDPRVNVDEIMSRIRTNIRARREQAEANGTDFETLARAQYGAPRGSHFASELYDALYEANVMQDKVAVSLALTPNSVPVVGNLIQRVRAALHNITIYYVNMAMGRQTAFNAQVVHVLNELVRDMEQNGSAHD